MVDEITYISFPESFQMLINLPVLLSPKPRAWFLHGRGRPQPGCSTRVSLFWHLLSCPALGSKKGREAASDLCSAKACPLNKWPEGQSLISPSCQKRWDSPKGVPVVLHRFDTRRAALTERSRPKHWAWPVFNFLSRLSLAFPTAAKENSVCTSSVAPAAAKALFLSPFKTALCYTVHEYIGN